MRSRLLRHRPKLVQALRMTVACLATYGLGEAFGLPQAYWAVITAIIVTQSSLGSSLKAAFDRFLGSVLGAAYGGLVTVVVPHHGGWTQRPRAESRGGAARRRGGGVGGGSGSRRSPRSSCARHDRGDARALTFALDRCWRVGLGCAVGLLVSSSSRRPGRRGPSWRRPPAPRSPRRPARGAGRPRRRGERRGARLPLATRRGLARLESLVAEADPRAPQPPRGAGRPRPAAAHPPAPAPRHVMLMLPGRCARAGTDVMRAHVAAPWGRRPRRRRGLRAIAAALASGRAAPRRAAT